MSTGQFQPTIENFAKGIFSLEGMVSHYIKFQEIASVFENMLNPPSDMKKMIILFE